MTSTMTTTDVQTALALEGIEVNAHEYAPRTFHLFAMFCDDLALTSDAFERALANVLPTAQYIEGQYLRIGGETVVCWDIRLA